MSIIFSQSAAAAAARRKVKWKLTSLVVVESKTALPNSVGWLGGRMHVVHGCRPAPTRVLRLPTWPLVHQGRPFDICRIDRRRDRGPATCVPRASLKRAYTDAPDDIIKSSKRNRPSVAGSLQAHTGTLCFRAYAQEHLRALMHRLRVDECAETCLSRPTRLSASPLP